MVFRAIAIVAILAQPLNVFSWSREGRHLVVEIAHSILDKSVTDVVDHYLGSGSWTEAVDWLETSATHRNNEARKQWQRVLIPRDETYVPVKTPNLINQLEYNLMVIEKRSLFQEKDVAEALKTLFALVADAHQPLRCGYPADQGGAATMVTLGEKSLTLFNLWDEELLRLRKPDKWDCTRLLISIPEKERNLIQNAGHLVWINESRELLKDVYAFENGRITEAYLDKAGDMARMQLVKAGLRLAGILGRHFRG